MRSIYQDNVLNKYDNYTYKWTMYMVHPVNAHKFEANIAQNNVVVIAESGVESEINIQSVEQNLVLAFKKAKDRNGLANMFVFNLVEPGGATLFNRILEGARRLRIENHLHACYLLELRFVGYDQNGTATNNIAGPFYYMTTMTSLTFDYREGATQYTSSLVETHQDAYKTLNLYTKQQLTVNSVNTFGEFLQQLQEKVNEQERESTALSPSKLFSTLYKFGAVDDTAEWLNWKFGASAASGDTSLKSTSVTGDGTLTFTFKQGTGINTAIVVALMQTDNFRKMPTFEGGFHKDNADDGEAKAPTFAELSSWFVFDNDTEFLRYDPVARSYQKRITFNLKKFATQELVHDAISYENLIFNKNIQEDRLKKIIREGLLRKRFDYTHTGLNTEVLNLDVSLHNTYFQLQAINHGKTENRAQGFAGMSEDQQQLSILQTDVQEIKSDLNALNVRKNILTKELENLDEYQLASDAGGQQQELAEIDQQIQKKEEELSLALISATELEKILNQDIKGSRLPPVARRYITQSEVRKNNKAFEQKGEDMPTVFDTGPVTSNATVGPDDGDTAGAAMLGAVELNLNSLSDLVQQQIQVRGDPYWLGRPKGSESRLDGAQYTRGGCNYFLNLNFPTYPDHQSGLMDISEQNFGIIGLYRVTSVDASYSDGQFTMTLDAFRDTNTNIGLTYNILTTGLIEEQDTRTQAERFAAEADAEEPPEADFGAGGDTTGDETAPPASADGTGVVTESQSSVASTRKLPIDPELKSILANAGAAAGVNVDVRSGGQDSSTGFTGSSRHNNGMAADVALRDSTGRRLSLDNPADVPIIQNFIAQTKRYGATGIGAGNGYMGDDTFHIDIADSVGQGAPGYWGGQLDNGTYRARNAPPWLRDIFIG